MTPCAGGATIPLFALLVALTVGFELVAALLCTLLMTSILKINQRYVADEEESEFIQRCYRFAANLQPGESGLPPKGWQRHLWGVTENVKNYNFLCQFIRTAACRQYILRPFWRPFNCSANLPSLQQLVVFATISSGSCRMKDDWNGWDFITLKFANFGTTF